MAVTRRSTQGLVVVLRVRCQQWLYRLSDHDIAANRDMIEKRVAMRPFCGGDGGFGFEQAEHHFTLAEHRSAETIDSRSLRKKIARDIASSDMRRTTESCLPIPFAPIP